MSLTNLREVSKNIQNSVYYTIMEDEVTDYSNKERFLVCLRWVDHNLVTHNVLVGLYPGDFMQLTTSETLANSLKMLYSEWVCQFKTAEDSVMTARTKWLVLSLA